MNMKLLNLRNCAKPIFVISLFALSFMALGLLVPSVSASHGEDGITQPLGVGADQIISFRDVTNILLQSSTLTVDTSEASSGSIIINLEEPDANFNATTIQVVLSSATSTTSDSVEAIVELTETGIDTGTFSGTLILSLSTTSGNNLEVARGDDISVFYEAESQGVGRFQAELDVTTAGNVKISDVLLDLDEFTVNHNFRPVTHPVKIKLDGATLDTSAGQAPIITISYANAVFQEFDNPSQLNMYYRPSNPPSCDECVGWDKIRDFTAADPSSHDAVGMTITSDVANTEFGTTKGKTIFGPEFGGSVPITEAEFMLGFEQGIGGGGGGGLVRPGLVVNALAGAGALSSFFGGGGGGGAGPNAPTVLSGSILSLEGTEFFDAFDSVDGIEGILSNTENSFDSTQTVNTGEPLTFVFDLYENGGKNNLEHVTLYMNIRGDETDVDSSDTYILFDRGQSTHIIDPHGIIENANFEILEKTAWDLVLKYDITFAKPMETSHIIIQSWDLDRHFSIKIFENALQVGDPNTIQVTQEITEEIIPEPEIQQLTSEDVPIWVKNNAGWWSQELIDDSDFIAGIEYLIQNKIIIILDDQVVTSPETSYQIPQWIKNNAGWWSEDLITEKDFTEGLQWLISNGVIRVQ